MNDSIKEFDKVLADLQEIKEKGNFIPDCSTKKGYEASKSFVLKVTTPARTALKNAHKEAKAFYLEGGREVDRKKNELMAELEASQAPHQEAYKYIDDEKKRAKEEKESRIQRGFDELRGYILRSINQDSKTISDIIDECSEFDANPEVYGKEIETIIALHNKVMGDLVDALAQATHIDEMKSQQEELDRKKKEIEKRESELEAKESIVFTSDIYECGDLHAESLREGLDDEYADPHEDIFKRLTDEGLGDEDATTVVRLITNGDLPRVSIIY